MRIVITEQLRYYYSIHTYVRQEILAVKEIIALTVRCVAREAHSGSDFCGGRSITEQSPARLLTMRNPPGRKNKNPTRLSLMRTTSGLLIQK